ncbi:TPA: hypothetical protein UMV35_003687 [Stenotrophomonas maltophilia]|nr:hypothetical protein [Stenotrophomonas maltophilia]HEL7728677.1 hypothetical protein [Stenotrophomonas maltophilia]
MSDKFNWSTTDRDTIVVPSVRGVAVYENDRGDVVIRQEAGPLDDEDSFVIVPKAFVPALIKALQAVEDEG